MKEEQEQTSSATRIELSGFSEEAMFKSKELETTETGIMKVNYSSGRGSTAQYTTRFVPTPIDFQKLAQMVDLAPSLDVSIDAMETNITGFGHRLECLLDVKEIKDEKTGKTIYIDPKTGQEVPQDRIDEKNDELERIERLLAVTATSDPEGWLGITKKKTRDLETFGNAWIEVERNIDGDIVNLHHLPAWSMRLMKKDEEKTLFEPKIRHPSTKELIEYKTNKCFRKSVQIKGKARRFFKEFGDPRLLDMNTGLYYESVEDPNLPEEFEPAGEVLYFNLYHPLYEYGLPRWLSATPVILSARAAHLMNYTILSNNGIPMGVMIIEGHYSRELEKKIKDEIEHMVRGEKSYHTMLVVQAQAQPVGPAGPGQQSMKPSIKIESLSDMVNSEGLFMDYSKYVDEVIVGCFRLPNLLVGKNNQITRATAEVALQIFEQQVLGPARHAHDFVINSKIFAEMDIKWWKYCTNSARLEDQEMVAKLAKEFADSGILMPREAREIAGRILNKSLEEIDQIWMNMPQDIYAKEPERYEEELTDEEGLPLGKLVKLSEADKDDITIQLLSKMLKIRDGLDIKNIQLFTKASDVPNAS